MPKKPCLVCGKVSLSSRCAAHAPPDLRRGRGRGWQWTAIAREVRSRQPWCQICGVRGVKLEVDHIVPASLGGTDALENLRSLCEPCHDRFGMKKKRAGARRGGDA